MTFVHFTTELSGGAGGFVRNLHQTMQGMGLPSLVMTRERTDLSGVVTLRPNSRIWGSLRARSLTLLCKLGLLNGHYAMFGIEKCPVVLGDIQQAVKSVAPSAFIFYWTSYFVDFETMRELKLAYPDVPIVLTCTDEAFLTGACHYSHGCEGFLQSCSNCPATSITWLQRRIAQRFIQRKALIDAIDPIVIYPTTNIQDMGSRSSAMNAARSWVVPLGAFSRLEQNQAQERRALKRIEQYGSDRKLTLLVRSSSEYRKGCDLFVSALKILSQRLPDLRNRLEVVSIGDATLALARIDQYVRHNPMGYVNRESLLSLYDRIDALLVTSREDGGPLMINESVALGVFVISTPVGVAKDLIISGRVGQITRDLSAEAIADSLSDFVEASPKQEIGSAADPSDHPAALTFEGYVDSLLAIITKSGERQ